MIKFLKRWWPTIIGLILLSVPGMFEKDVYLLNVVCSVIATVFFAISICLDENWRLKEELRFNNKETLEKIQSILFVSVLLLLTLIGYLFEINGLILFYVHRNGFSVGIIPILASLFVVGVFTLFYKIRLRFKREN